MDDKLKKIKKDMEKLKKETEQNVTSCETEDEKCNEINTFELLSTQLLNINKGHRKLLSDIRNQGAEVVKQLLEHTEK
jgi:hypothetical protein